MSNDNLKSCPQCENAEELFVSSNGSMQISEVACNCCGYSFQSKCYEENIYKYWNKLPRADETLIRIINN